MKPQPENLTDSEFQAGPAGEASAAENPIKKSKKEPKFKKGRRFSRTSAVGRLPRVIRDKVDEMIDDGVFYKEICEWVKKETGVQLNHDVLSTWRMRGHDRWLQEQERIREMRETRAFALEVMKENQGKVVTEAGLEIAASQLYQMLMKFKIAELKKELSKDPEAYPKVVRMLARVSEGGLKYEKHRLEKEKAEVEAREEGKEESDEEMDEVLRALRVM